MFHGLPTGLDILLGFLGGLLSCAIFIAFIWGIRVALAGFLYHMEDYTTGFLKVRARAQAANSAAVWMLANHESVDEVFGEHALTLGSTESSGHSQPFIVPGDYRTTHMYVVGASGAGKSSLLKNLIFQDLNGGMGLCVIDPHGDLIADCIPYLGERKDRAILLDLADTEHMLAYNPLERKPGVLVAEQVAKLLLAFKRIWEDSWGPRMEDILRHTLALLIEHGYTLAEFERVLTDWDFRAMLLEATETAQTREFFYGRYNVWNSKERQLFIESSMNKVSAFLADPRIGARLAQPKSGFNIREVMDTGGVLFVNLAKGRLGGSADLFGALMMADIETSFLTRAAGQRKPFALYADEFQNIATESFGTVLTEARKFGLCLTMAHQSVKQLDEKLIALILGNAQTQVYFRVSRQDAERLAKESANIVEQLEGRDEHLMQEPESKFSMHEMWEIAFHSLARLEPRKAYVMVKGAMEHPELIRTLDNPASLPRPFAFGESYQPLGAFESVSRQRTAAIDDAVKLNLQQQKDKRKRQKPEDSESRGDEPPRLDLPPEE